MEVVEVHTLYQDIDMVDKVVQAVEVLQDLRLRDKQLNQLNQEIVVHTDLEIMVVIVEEAQVPQVHHQQVV